MAVLEEEDESRLREGQIGVRELGGKGKGGSEEKGGSAKEREREGAWWEG